MFNGFPASYNNPYYMQNGYGQNTPTPQNQANNNNFPPVPQIPNHMQNGGFIRVQSENEARMYPIQPGTSATFIDENAPYCYTKTLDFSQLDRPIFKRFRLVEEDASENAQNAPAQAAQNEPIDLTAYALKADMDALAARIAALESSYAKKPAVKAKKEDEA